MTKIERIDDPSKAHWVPVLRKGKYQLIDRSIRYPDRNLAVNITPADTADQAADLIEKDYGIRMGAPGASSGDYIYPPNLKITRM